MMSQPDSYRLRLPRHRAARGHTIAAPPPVHDSDQVELASCVHVLRHHLWLVAAITFVVTFAAAAYALLARPVYEASMLIHVEEAAPAAARNVLTEAASMFETKKAATAEMELLRSRAVVGPAVERLKLYIDARPDYFPLIGRLVADARPGQLSQPGLFGFGGKVWGAEQIEVPLFDVPPALYRRGFVVTSLGDGRFSLFEPVSNFIAYGKVGPAIRVATAAGPLVLQVARLEGRPGARFLLSRTSPIASIRKLQRELAIGEQGKQSGVIEVRLEGKSPELVSALLFEIGRQYMAQNVARKSEDAEQSLAFLDQQLPKLKARLEQAEGDYNAFRKANGSIDVTEEARLSLQQAAAAKLRRSELLQKRTELLTRFTGRHPVVAAMSGQLAEVERELADIARHIKTLPLLEQDAVRLSREVKVNTDLYTALANTAQQLRTVSAGKAGNVRLVDAPVVVDEPVRPHRGSIVGAGLAGGLLLGVAAAFVRARLAGGVEDPARLEQMLGSRVVFASIPHSDAQARLNKRGFDDGRQPLLALDRPTDGAIEALRSFRASLQFSMPQFDSNVIMFAGPTSSLGKSFVSANFAAVMAAGGKRVLLVDADVRNGRLHQYFGTPREHGLCEALASALPLGRAIRHDVVPNLDFIPTGSLAVGEPDIFMHADVGALLASVSGHYDLVLVDSPPILALADALVLGSHAGAVFLVVRAGVSTEREITESIRRLNQAGVAPFGIVFNDVQPRLSGYGYKYGYGDVGRLEYSG
ncbi:MAG: Tyrosine protein kinase [Massilia sp.]|nr:Tyrosine protein kinase [Massilia sp.]